MRAIEFYTTPDGEVTLKAQGEAERQLKQEDTEFIQAMLGVIMEYYPTAYKALMEIYRGSEGNKQYRDFLAVRRFIKCNFGVYDNTIDIDAQWNFNFEFVSCPLRGECKHDHLLCQPAFDSKLSERQLEVMRLCYEGKDDGEIADTLYISINTVANHRKTAFRKLGLHNMSEFIRYANQNKLFSYGK